MKEMGVKEAIENKTVEQKIYLIRGQRVMLDNDLAELYGVETKYLTRQVRRNIRRFPGDFMFQLTREEFLRCQFVTSKRGGRRYLPYVFTEQGIAMLSTVLGSEKAIKVNIEIMRAFVKLRSILMEHKDLKRKIEDMEKKYDAQFRVVFDAIRQLLEPPKKVKRRIGYK